MRGMGGVTLAVAGLVFTASAVALGATVADALRVEASPGVPEGVAAAQAAPLDDAAAEVGSAQVTPTAGAPGGEARAQGSLPGTPYPGVTQNEILEAVNLDLFKPDRTPPLMPYLLPGERPVAAPQRQEERRRGPELRVVGAAVMGEGGMALVQVGDTFPLALRVGESVEGYVLASVDGEFATLVREEETLTLPVVEPVRVGSSSSSRQANPRGQAEQQIQERFQDMLRGIMQGGGRGGVVAPGGERVIRLPGGVVEFTTQGGQVPAGLIDRLRQGGQLPPGAQVQIRRPGGGGEDHP